MRRVLIAAAAIACGACSAIAGLNKDYVALESTTGTGPSDAGLSDAGNGPGPGPTGDARAPDAGVPFACPETGAIFCTDFEVADLSKWTRREETGGLLKLVDGIGVGSTRGLDAKMTAATPGTVATVSWKTVATRFDVGTTITLHFAFNVLRRETSYAALGVIQFVGIEHGLAMYDSSKCNADVESCLDENDQSGPGNRGHDASNSTPLALGTWHEGLVSLTRNAEGYRGTVAVDGTVVDERASGAMPANADTRTVEIGVGSFYSSGKGTNDVVIDDVLVDAVPPP